MPDPSEIVKVQRALFPVGSAALIYDKASKHTTQAVLSDREREQMGGDSKAFFRAVWTGKSWVLRQRVGGQDW